MQLLPHAPVRSRHPFRWSARAVFVLAALALATQAIAQLRGHGGPVRAVAVSADGRTALSGSFDQTAIRWSLAGQNAEQVLRSHEGAVNAVALLADGRAATAGEDARIAIWGARADSPERVLEGHTAPISALAASRDGKTLASASWDRTVRVWPLEGGAPQVLEGHTDNVNGVSFTPDDRAIVSAGYDATVRIWPRVGDAAPQVTTVPAPLNAVALAPDGEIVVAGANGHLYFLSSRGELRGSMEISPSPLIALAVSRDGTLVAAGGIRGAIAIVDRASRAVSRSLVGPGLPVWSMAFLSDAHVLLTGGSDRLIRRWNADTGEHLGAIPLASQDSLGSYAGDPGAEVYRACVACHTLTPDEGNRAGPTLHGIFGRRIATLPGYNFSPALRQMDIVWSKETVAKLFELGPASYTPGTKMPEQRITSAADRQALVDFLERATTPKSR